MVKVQCWGWLKRNSRVCTQLTSNFVIVTKATTWRHISSSMHLSTSRIKNQLLFEKSQLGFDIMTVRFMAMCSKSCQSVMALTDPQWDSQIHIIHEEEAWHRGCDAGSHTHYHGFEPHAGHISLCLQIHFCSFVPCPVP